MPTLMRYEIITFVECCDALEQGDCLFRAPEFDEELSKTTSHGREQSSILSALRSVQYLAERCFTAFDFSPIEQMKGLLKLLFVAGHDLNILGNATRAIAGQIQSAFQNLREASGQKCLRLLPHLSETPPFPILNRRTLFVRPVGAARCAGSVALDEEVMFNPMCRLQTGDGEHVLAFMQQRADRAFESSLLVELPLRCIAIFLASFELSAGGRPKRRLVLILVTKEEQPTLGIENDQASGASVFSRCSHRGDGTPVNFSIASVSSRQRVTHSS
jgi:hypothetical protein